MDICEDSLSRKEMIKFFPWIKAVKRRFSKSFPDDYDLDTLNSFHTEIEKELETVSIESSTRNEALFSALVSFYNHFCFKLRFRECSPDMKSSCAKLLSSLSKVGLVLSEGDIQSKWMGQVLSAVKVFPGDCDLLYDALLRINRLKKKFHGAYSVLLKNTLCCHRALILDPSTYFKLMFLYRRLKLVTENPHERAGLVSMATRVEVPRGTKQWLTRHGLEEIRRLKRKEIAQRLMKKTLSREVLHGLRDIILPDASVRNVAVAEESEDGNVSAQFFVDSTPRNENDRPGRTEEYSTTPPSNKKRKTSSGNKGLEDASPDSRKRTPKSKRKSPVHSGEASTHDSSAKKKKLDPAKKSCEESVAEESVILSYPSPEEIECIEIRDESDEARSQSCLDSSSQRSTKKSSRSNKKSKKSAGNARETEDCAVNPVLANQLPPTSKTEVESIVSKKTCVTFGEFQSQSTESSQRSAKKSSRSNKKSKKSAGNARETEDCAVNPVLANQLPPTSKAEVESSVSKKKKTACGTFDEFQSQSTEKGNETQMDIMPVSKRLSKRLLKKTKQRAEDAIEIQNKEYLDCLNVGNDIKLGTPKQGKKETHEADNSLVEQDAPEGNHGEGKCSASRKRMKRKRHQKAEAESSAVEPLNAIVIDNVGDYSLPRKNKKRKSKTEALDSAIRNNDTNEALPQIKPDEHVSKEKRFSGEGHRLAAEMLLTANVDEVKEMCSLDSEIDCKVQSVQDLKRSVKPVAESDAMIVKLDAIEPNINTIDSSMTSDAVESIVESEAAESVVKTDEVECILESDTVQSAVESIAVSDVVESIAVSDVVESIAVSDVVESIALSDVVESIAVSDVVESIAVSDVVESSVESDAVQCKSQPIEKSDAVESDTVKSIVGSDAVQSVVESDAIESIVVSDVVASSVESDAVQCKSQPIEKSDAVESDTVKSIVESDAIESTVVSNVVESSVESVAVQPIVKSDAVDSIVESIVEHDAVDSFVVSDTIQSVEKSDVVETIVESGAVKSILKSDVIESSIESNAVESIVRLNTVVHCPINKSSAEQLNVLKPVVESDIAKPTEKLAVEEHIAKSVTVDSVSELDALKSVVESNVLTNNVTDHNLELNAEMPIANVDKVDPIQQSGEVEAIQDLSEVEPILVSKEVAPLLVSKEVAPVLVSDEVEPIQKSNEVESIPGSDEVEPIQDSDEIEPTQDSAEVKSILVLDEMKPIQKSDEVEDIVVSDEVAPIQDSDAVHSLLVLNEMESIQKSDDVEPIQNSNEVEPIQESDDVESIQDSAEVEPIQDSDGVEPIQNSNEVEPIQESDEVENIHDSDEVRSILVLDEKKPIQDSSAIQCIVDANLAEPITKSNKPGAIATGTVTEVNEVVPIVKTNINVIENDKSSQDNSQSTYEDTQNSANEIAAENETQNLTKDSNLIHIDSVSDKIHESDEGSDTEIKNNSEKCNIDCIAESSVERDVKINSIPEGNSLPQTDCISEGFNSSDSVSNEIQESVVAGDVKTNSIPEENNCPQSVCIPDETQVFSIPSDTEFHSKEETDCIPDEESNGIENPSPTTNDNSGTASNIIASSGKEMSQKNSETVEDIAEALYKKILKAKENSSPKVGHCKADLGEGQKSSRETVDDVAETLYKRVSRAKEESLVKIEDCYSESMDDLEVDVNEEVKLEVMENEAPLKLQIETLPKAVQGKTAADILTENTVSYVMEKMMKKVEFVNYVPRGRSSDGVVEESGLQCSTEERDCSTPFGFSKEESVSFMDLKKEPQSPENPPTESKNFFPYRRSLVIDVPDDKSESNFSDVICSDKLEETLHNTEESSENEATEIDEDVADSPALGETVKEEVTVEFTLSEGRAEAIPLESSESNEQRCDASPIVCPDASEESGVQSDCSASTEILDGDRKILISLVRTLQVPVVNLGSRCDIDDEKKEGNFTKNVCTASKSVNENSTADEVSEGNSNENERNVSVGTSENLDKQDGIVDGDNILSTETLVCDQNSKDTVRDTSTNAKELDSPDEYKESNNTRRLRKRNVQSVEKQVTPERSSSRLRKKPTSIQKTEPKEAVSKSQCRSSKRLKKDINAKLQEEFKDLSLQSPKLKRRDPILFDSAAEDDRESSNGGGNTLKVGRRATRSSKKCVPESEEATTKEDSNVVRRSSRSAPVNKFYLIPKVKLNLTPISEKGNKEAQNDSNPEESSQKVTTRSNRLEDPLEEESDVEDSGPNSSKAKKRSTRASSVASEKNDSNSKAGQSRSSSGTSRSEDPLEEESDVEDSGPKSSKAKKRSTRASSVASEKNDSNSKAGPNGESADVYSRETTKAVRRSTRTSSRTGGRLGLSSKATSNLKPVDSDSEENGDGRSSSVDSSRERTKAARVSVEEDSDGDVRSVVSEGSLKENSIVDECKESQETKMSGGARGYSLRSKRSVIMPGKLNILKSDNCP